LNYFYVSDGGFFANNAPGEMNRERDWDKWPFRTIATGPEKDFPVINNYGHAAYSDSPTYYAPYKGASVGHIQLPML